MFCATVPVTAAIGTSLENKQRKNTQAQGRTPKRIRPFMALTIYVLFLLVVGSVIVYWLIKSLFS